MHKTLSVVLGGDFYIPSTGCLLITPLDFGGTNMNRTKTLAPTNFLPNKTGCKPLLLILSLSWG